MHVRNRPDLLPLRQMVSANEDAALVFAGQGLLNWLSKPDRFQIIGHGHGAQILAASEFALAEAQRVVRQAYGDLVTFGTATVHTYLDRESQTPMVPVMFVRLDAPRRHKKELLDLLRARTAHMRKVDVQRDRVVIRAELELSRALGLQREVHELTDDDGSAHFLCWLLGYRRAVHRVVMASSPSAAHADVEGRSDA